MQCIDRTLEINEMLVFHNPRDIQFLPEFCTRETPFMCSLDASGERIHHSLLMILLHYMYSPIHTYILLTTDCRTFSLDFPIALHITKNI